MTRRVAVGAGVMWLLVMARFAGAQAPPPASPSVGAAVAVAPGGAAAVAEVIGGFIEALNAADVQRLSPFFADDATMFFPLAPFYLRLENKEQIVKVFTAFFASVRKGKPSPTYMSLAAQDLRIQMFGNVAIVTFHFKGPDNVARRTVVLAHEGGRWLIVHLHASGLNVREE